LPESPVISRPLYSGKCVYNREWLKTLMAQGCFMLMHTGEKVVISKNNLLTTVAWQVNNKTEYALEGSIFIAGAVVQWLRDGIHMIRSSQILKKWPRE
jgi:glycerol kinase